MLSRTTERNLYGKLSNDSSDLNLTLGDTLLNESRRQILATQHWKFLEKTKNLSTVASQQGYDLPSDFRKMESLTVTVGSFTYSPEKVESREVWDSINLVSVTSDIPQFYFVFNNQVLLYPTPASSTSNAITFIYTRTQKDLSVADYTTGTITSVANGASAVVGNGTTWTTKMNNRWIRITDSNDANTGDGEWYEISPVLTTTTLTLDRLYNGLSISGGTATYTIAQVSLLPEPFQMLPIYKALVTYFTSIKPDTVKANLYNDQFTNLLNDMRNHESGYNTSPVISSGYIPLQNPNNFYQV